MLRYFIDLSFGAQLNMLKKKLKEEMDGYSQICVLYSEGQDTVETLQGQVKEAQKWKEQVDILTQRLRSSHDKENMMHREIEEMQATRGWSTNISC